MGNEACLNKLLKTKQNEEGLKDDQRKDGQIQWWLVHNVQWFIELNSSNTLKALLRGQ